MRLNWTTKIKGDKVVLVPYCEHHVATYHEWMKSEELRHLTGSEPLTLEEEFAMQQTWLESEDKCTFIVLSKQLLQDEKTINDEINAMVGDTNIFVRTDDQGKPTVGEAEIMIAEKSARGQGLGWEAMCLLLLYGVDKLNLKRYEAKIKTENHASIAMFAKLGFAEVSRSLVFGEITFSRDVTDEWMQFLSSTTRVQPALYALNLKD